MGAPPPRAFVEHLSFWRKNVAMPHYGVQIMQQNPHPWGLTLTQMPTLGGQNISFLRISDPEN
jgi:hypothetical protein